jgi:hypothetical protein
MADETGENAGDVRWALALGCRSQEPWHWFTARMLQTAVAVAVRDGDLTGGVMVQVPRSVVLLAALAFYVVAREGGVSDLELTPVDPVIALLADDAAARGAARAVPVRSGLGDLARQGSPAVRPPDRARLDRLLEHRPADWERTRLDALRLVARAELARLGGGGEAEPAALGCLSPRDWETVRLDWVDRPDRPIGNRSAVLN